MLGWLDGALPVKTLSVVLKDEQFAALERLVQLSDERTISYHVRRAVDEYVRRELQKAEAGRS